MIHAFNQGERLMLLLFLLLLAGSETGLAELKSAAAPQPLANSASSQPATAGGLTQLSTPVADYQFAGDLGSRVAGAPDLTDTATGSQFDTATVNGVVRPVRAFDAGNGLRLAGADALISDSVYSIQMTVFLNDLTGGGTNFVKLLDFGDLGDDFGLYAVNSNGNPTITFFDSAGQPFGVSGAFPEQDWVQVVITRDSNNTITVYLDGIQQFTHAAAAADTDVAGPLVFLDDDSATGGSEISSGAIACLRLYPTALDPTTVATLDCARVMRVGINGQACAFTTIGSAVLAAQSGDNILIEAGTYNGRIGAVVNKDLQLLAARAGSNCMQAEPFPGDRALIDGTGFTGFNGAGGILDLIASNVSLTQVDLANGSTGQGGLVAVREEGSLLTFGSTFSNGTASADLVNVGLGLDTDDPAGGCVYAETASLDFEETTFFNCRVIGPNNGADPANGDGGAVHARLESVVEADFAIFTNNSARNGGAVALIDAADITPFSVINFSNNTAANFGGAIAADNSGVRLGFNSGFVGNMAGNRGGALDISGGSLEIVDLAVFENNSAVGRGGAIHVLGADLAIRPSSIPDVPTRVTGNSAVFGGAIFIEGGTTGALTNPTIEGALFDGNTAGVSGGAMLLANAADVEIVDTIFSNNSASEGGAIYSQASSSVVRSSSGCKAFEFADPDRYCSEFRNNNAGDGSAIMYIAPSNSRILTTAFVGNSGPNAVQLSNIGNGNDVSMESVWMFDNQGDAVQAAGDSFIQVNHGTFHNNVGSAFVGLEQSSLFMFNSIAFGNGAGGVSSLGTGGVSFGCNFDQSTQVGVNTDPLLVTNADGQSHLDPASPAIDACFVPATLPVDLDGRDRVFGPAPDAGAFEANDILFENGFE